MTEIPDDVVAMAWDYISHCFDDNMIDEHNEEVRNCLRATGRVFVEWALAEAAKEIDCSMCDPSHDEELFMAHRDYFAARVRALKDKTND